MRQEDGAQRIANYLLRKRIKLSAMMMWRMLKEHQVKAVVKRRKKPDYIRYSKEISREKVQLDVMKVRDGTYQFTAIDDYTRLRTIRVYPDAKIGKYNSFFRRDTEHFFSSRSVDTD